MDKIEIVEINGVEYISGDIILKTAPKYSKGFKTARVLLRMKSVPKDDYVFAKNCKGKWILSSGVSIKFDKVFIKKEYVEQNIPEISGQEDKKEDDSDTKPIIYEKIIMPNIIDLRNDEKFKDHRGNIINIETRGERAVDKIFFKVTDVAIKFDQQRLHDTLLNKQGTYTEHNDYEFLYYPPTPGQKDKRELFLTYTGFRKYIETTKSIIFSKNTKYTMHKWLSQLFDTTKLQSFHINIKKYIILSTIGYTYCATSSTTNSVKIGYWKSNLSSLRSRYVTPYGDDVQIIAIKTNDAHKLEKMCHAHFSNYNIRNELFEKQYIGEYVEYLNSHSEYVNDEIFNIITDTNTTMYVNDLVLNKSIDDNDINIENIICEHEEIFLLKKATNAQKIHHEHEIKILTLENKSNKLQYESDKQKLQHTIEMLNEKILHMNEINELKQTINTNNKTK